MKHVTRINLKTSGEDRKKLIDFCLNSAQQYLAIGWSYVYSSDAQKHEIQSYQDYYCTVKKYVKR